MSPVLFMGGQFCVAPYVDIGRLMKKVLSDYNEIQFIQFMNELFAANDGASDDVLDLLLEEFERLTEHPDGSDLIYYPEDEGAMHA